jgi:twitching motility protein PilT
MPGRDALGHGEIAGLLEEIVSAERWRNFENTGDVDFAHAVEDGSRFRVNYNVNQHGLGAVFRHIPANIRTLEELGAPPALRHFAEFNSGLCLITGPTGSGKSTTLAALIDHINSTQRRVILTIEEPIEYVHPFKHSTVIQREVGTDVPAFSDALRGAVRQDVEVVLVGEMRDIETISLAITAAEMGMLVFATLHTNSAAKTIDRIIDVFPADQKADVRESLATALRAVCAQLLLKRSDIIGRIAVHEILFQTTAVSNMIRESKTNNISQVILSSKAMGMQLLDDAIEALLRAHVISGHEAYMKANDKARFRQYAPTTA